MSGVVAGTPVLNATFNSGTDGNVVTELTEGWETRYDSTQAYGGSGKSAKIQITGGASGFAQWGGTYQMASALQRYDEVWVRLRCRFPTGFDWTNSDGNASLIKFFSLRNTQIGTGTSFGNNHLTFSHTTTNGSWPNQLRYIQEAEDVWLSSDAISVQADTWHTFEMYNKIDSVRGSLGGQSMLRLWFDGSLILSTNDRTTLASTDSEIRTIFFFTYWNSVAPQTQHGWMDDITIYTGASPPGNLDGSGNRFIGT